MKLGREYPRLLTNTKINMDKLHEQINSFESKIEQQTWNHLRRKVTNRFSSYIIIHPHKKTKVKNNGHKVDNGVQVNNDSANIIKERCKNELKPSSSPYR